MATIILRQGAGGKGSPLTNAEVDANFTNLNTDKIENADAVSTNTANKVVKRDASGNFSAGTITATLSGNAATATSATTAINIAGGSAGTIPYQTAAGTTAQLAAGTSGQILKSNGAAAPSWVSTSAIDAGSVDGKSFGTFSTGGILYATSSTDAQTIAAGTTGQVLVSNGSSAPSWSTIGITASDDTTTDASYYPSLLTTTSGTISSVKVTSTKLYFNPSTGTLNATIFNSLSDASQKTNIEPIINATKTLGKIEAVEFDWIDSGKHSSGVVANQLEQILPFLVDTNNEGIKSVNYSGLIAYLIKSNKELAQRIEKLENQ